jgi:hypothetical protein
VPQRKLNLLQRRPSFVRQFRKRSSEIVRSDFLHADLGGILLHRLENGLCCHAVAAHSVAFVFGEESKSSYKQFLFRRIAWRLQARVEGDLSDRARRRAIEIASDADLRTRAPKGFLPGNAASSSPWSTDRSQLQRDWRLPAPGSLLTRRLDDRQIVVKVLEEGFEYESRRYRSLSAIAREVTGTRWNGLLFFGLAERPDA